MTKNGSGNSPRIDRTSFVLSAFGSRTRHARQRAQNFLRGHKSVRSHIRIIAALCPSFNGQHRLHRPAGVTSRSTSALPEIAWATPETEREEEMLVVGVFMFVRNTLEKNLPRASIFLLFLVKK